jgi:hypothetical protein
MTEEKAAELKAILLKLTVVAENLEASQAVVIATLQKQLKVSRFEVDSAISQTKFANNQRYDALRKAIEKLSS